MKARKKSTPAAKVRRNVVKKSATAKAKMKTPKRASVTKRVNGEAEKRKLVHELGLKHAELQSQNVELQKSRTDLEMVLQGYTDLYDYAPAGYLTLDRAGTIKQANLTAAVLLGCTRERLVGGRLALFVSKADRKRVNSFLKDIFETGKRQSCEVGLLAKVHPSLVVHIEASLSPDGKQCRVVLVDVTALAQGRLALRESEERWKFALEGAGDGVWDWDVVTSRVIFSKRWKSMIGFEDDELPNHFDEWSKRVHPEDLPGAMAKVNALFDGSVSAYACEFRMKCKDGSWKWILARGSVTSRDGKGNALRVIGTHTDVSDRKAAEEREARNLKLISEGASCSAVLDAITRHVEVEIPGMLCAVMLVGPGRGHLLVGAAPSLPEYFRKALQGLTIGPDAACSGTAVHTGKRVIAEDIQTDPRWAPLAKLAARAKLRSCWAEPVVGQSGQVLGAFACYHRGPHFPSPAEIEVVTAAAQLAAVAIGREAADRALREGEARYRRIVETTEEGIITIDSKARIDFVNPKMLTMLGHGEEAMIGRKLEDFMDEEGRTLLAKYIKRRQQGISEQFEFKFLRKDGSALWTWISTNPITDAGGLYIGALAMVTDITSRKAAEAALRAERTRLRTVLDVLPISIYVKDTHSRFLVANEGAAKAVGAARWEDMIGKTDADYFPPATAATFHGDEQRVLAGESVVDLEEPSVAPDGKDRMELTTKVPLRDGDGQITGLVGVSRDITESKQAAAALLESEERYRLLAENTDDMIVLHDTHWNRLYISPSYERKTGWTPDEVMATDWRTRSHPDELEKIRIAREENLRGKTTRVEHRLRCKDGSWLWFDTIGKPLRGPDGHIWRVLVWLHDITARREAEIAVRESEEKFRSIFDQAAVGVAVIDSHTGRFIDVNQRHCQITRLAREQTLATTFREITHPEDRQMDADNMSKLRAGTVRTLRVEKRYLQPDGAITWVNVTVSPMWKPGEEPTSHIAVVEDITRRKLVEDALRVSEEKYRTLFENAGDAIFLLEEGHFLDCNARALEMFGCELRNEFVGHPPYEFSPPRQPDGGDSQELAIQKIRSTRAGYPQFFEWMHQRRDGTLFPAEVSLNAVKVRERVLLQAFVRDISARKQAEQLLAWEKSAMELIGSPASLHEVLDKLMLGLEKQLPEALCSVLLLDGDGIHLRHGAAPSLPEAYNHAIDGLEIGPTVGSCGTAAYTKRQVIVTDIDTDPLWSEYREVALGHALHACWSTPIIGHEGKVLGTFAVYHREPCQPRPVELDCVTRAVHVTRIAIERKQAEEALRKSEQKFRAIFEQAAVGVAMIDSNTGRFLSVNQRHCDIAHLTREKILSDTFMSITHPDDLQEDLDNMEKLKAGLIPAFAMEKRYLHPDGATTWINLTVSPMWQPGEAPTTHIAVVEDITAQKLAQQALKESEERYSRAVRGSSDGLWDWVIPTRELYLSPRWKEMLGFADHELPNVEESFFSRIHTDDADRVQEAVNAHLEQHEPYDIELRLKTKSGGYRWVRSRGEVEWDENGRATHMAGTITDITERKLAQEKFVVEQEFNQALVAHTSALIVVLNEQSNIVHVNPAFVKELGYELSDLAGRPLWDSGMMSAAESFRSQERYKRLTEGLENPPTEVRLRAKNGEWHLVELTAIATRLADNNIDRIILTCTDITERTRLQHEVLRISEQEQASIGHNLHDGVGQTMTGVATMLEHLESTLSGDQQKIATRIRELVQESVAEVRRMSHGLSPVAVQLRGLAGGLQLLAETIRTNYRAESICEVDPTIVINDTEKETHLYHIAQEAINNALRHGRAKQVNLSLKRLSDMECALQIEDNGSGIKTGKKAKGNGVGLRVMQYRAGLIGGEVNIISRLPSGVGIVCRFPCNSASNSKKAKPDKLD